MVIGAFVVGPPLAQLRPRARRHAPRVLREKLLRRVRYAYAYPAMAKAVQAAGRVIRSETDQGLIVLMDGRFIQPSYAQVDARRLVRSRSRGSSWHRTFSKTSPFWQECVEDSHYRPKSQLSFIPWESSEKVLHRGLLLADASSFKSVG